MWCRTLLSLAFVQFHLRFCIGSPRLTLLEDSTATFQLHNGTLLAGPVRGYLTQGQVHILIGQRINDGLDYVYIPERDFSGHDIFSYVADSDNSITTIELAVQPVNDDPIVKDDTVTSYHGEAVSILVLANDEDVDEE